MMLMLYRIMYLFATRNGLSAEVTSVRSTGTWLPRKERKRLEQIVPHLELGKIILHLRGNAIGQDESQHTLHQRPYTSVNPNHRFGFDLEGKFLPGTLVISLGVFTPKMYVKNPKHDINHRRLEEDTILYVPALEERGIVAEVHQGNGPFWNPILYVELFSTYQPGKGKRITYPSLLDASYAPTYFFRFMTLAEKLWHVHLFSQRVFLCVKEISAVMLTVTSAVASMLLALNNERFFSLEKRNQPDDRDGDSDGDDSSHDSVVDDSGKKHDGDKRDSEVEEEHKKADGDKKDSEETKEEEVKNNERSKKDDGGKGESEVEDKNNKDDGAKMDPEEEEDDIRMDESGEKEEVVPKKRKPRNEGEPSKSYKT
jgi:hypothetical protein